MRAITYKKSENLTSYPVKIQYSKTFKTRSPLDTEPLHSACLCTCSQAMALSGQLPALTAHSWGLTALELRHSTSGSRPTALPEAKNWWPKIWSLAKVQSILWWLHFCHKSWRLFLAWGWMKGNGAPKRSQLSARVKEIQIASSSESLVFLAEKWGHNYMYCLPQRGWCIY